jgi:hypothetical protein
MNSITYTLVLESNPKEQKVLFSSDNKQEVMDKFYDYLTKDFDGRIKIFKKEVIVDKIAESCDERQGLLSF